MIDRPKQGFQLPLVEWMKYELKQQLLAVLLEPRTLDRGYFRQRVVRILIEEQLRGRRSRLYTLSGLDKAGLEARVMAECSNGGDFLRILMEQMCRKQGVARWADTTPEHLLYLPRIKATIPGALIVHIIRDGRDVALST